MSEIFDHALSAFIAAYDKVLEDVNAKSTMKHYGPTKLDIGSKFIRVVRSAPDGKSRSVACFVSKETGGIFKAAGWKAPAKGERASIFKPESYKGMDPYGSWLYLR